jgi:hypothetical protein
VHHLPVGLAGRRHKGHLRRRRRQQEQQQELSAACDCHQRPSRAQHSHAAAARRRRTHEEGVKVAPVLRVVHQHRQLQLLAGGGRVEDPARGGRRRRAAAALRGCWCVRSGGRAWSGAPQGPGAAAWQPPPSRAARLRSRCSDMAGRCRLGCPAWPAAAAAAHHTLPMSMKGDTCSAFCTRWPLGSNTNVTRSPHGVLVTCGGAWRRGMAWGEAGRWAAGAGAPRRCHSACVIICSSSRHRQPEASPPPAPAHLCDALGQLAARPCCSSSRPRWGSGCSPSSSGWSARPPCLCGRGSAGRQAVAIARREGWQAVLLPGGGSQGSWPAAIVHD